VTDSPLAQLTLARLRVFFREPGAVFWAMGFPLLLTVALGVAFRSRPPEAVRVAVVTGPEAVRWQAALRKAGGIEVEETSAAEARRRFRAGKVALVLEPGLPRTYVVDPMRPDSRLARLLVDDALQVAEGRLSPTVVRERAVSEPGSRYVDFVLPGLIGMNLMSSGMWGVGYVVVEMRARKELKRLLATPMRRRDFLLSLLLMRGVFLLVELPLLLAFGHWLFGVQVQGSLALFAGLAALGALTFAGLGLLVASRAQNTQTVGGLMNLVMMPMFLCSGVFFSSAQFPDVLQPAIRALPLTALNDALRAVANEAVGPAQVATEAGLLAVVGLVSFAAALRWFRWN
jgi:ABC-type multidrug transport system permease subunit